MSLLERNLEALAAWTPATAAIIAATVNSPEYNKTTGTDGTPTYCRFIDAAPRRLEWLGGTSMPAASAIPLIESLAIGTNNGLGLSIGTGHEWAAFARKLSNAQAVLVYEPDPALLRMALDVCDLSVFLRSGKIVIFSGIAEAASNEISAFLTTHLGYETPSVLHPLPTLTGERRNPLLAVGEAIVRRVIPERQMLVNTLAGRVEQALLAPTDARIAFTLTPRYVGERPIRCELKDVPELRLNHFSSTSIAARLKMIAEHRPREILSDLFRPQIGCVPPTVAVETWIPPTVGPAYWDRLPADGELHPNDRIVVHNGFYEQRLIERGIPKAQIHFRPLRPQIMVAAEEPSISLRHRVAIIGDLMAIDPAALAIQLPTHLAVYTAARELIAGDFLTMYVGSAPDILRRALARANVAAGPEGANDPALREPMLRVIRDVLLPTVPLLTLAEMLVAQSFPLRLIGEWIGFAPGAGRDVVFEPFPAWQDEGSNGKNDWRDSAVLMHLSPAGSVSSLLWDAVNAGVAIVSPQHPADAVAGALPSLLKPNVEFAHPTPQQCVATLKSLLRDSDRRMKFVTAAHRRAGASRV